MHGLHVTLALSAALLLAGAVAALRLPRVMDCGAVASPAPVPAPAPAEESPAPPVT